MRVHCSEHMCFDSSIRAEYDAQSLKARRVIEMALSACSDDGNANGLGLRGEWKMHSALVHTELQMIVSCHALNPIECSEDLLLRSDQCEIVEDADSVTLDESSEGSSYSG